MTSAKSARRLRAAFAKPRRARTGKGAPDIQYQFRHIRRDGTPDAIPAIPSLAEALEC